MTGYVPGEQPKERRYIKLNTNENPYPPSPKAAEAYRALLTDAFRLYSDPLSDDLRSAAAKAFGVAPDWIIAGNGSDDILTIAIRSFVDQGGTVATLNPSYSLYPVLADIQGAKTVTVPLTDDFSLPEDVTSQIKGANIFFLTRPNAPTGNSFPLEEIEAICRRFDGVVLVDEAYADFGRDNCLHLLRQFDNVIVSRTLSKSYALAGLRVGFGVAKPRLIEGMMKVKDSYNLNRVSQVVGAAALRDSAYLKETRARIVATRENTASQLCERGFSVIPSETNFLFARPPKGETAAAFFEKLRNAGILVRYFGNSDKTRDYLRITIGTEDEMKQFVEVVDGVLPR